MSLVFTNYYPLEELVGVNVSGDFNKEWDGKYVLLWYGNRGYTQPSTGSGLSVGSLPILDMDMLPRDVRGQLESAQGNNGNGWVYVIRSCKFRILYVGITKGNLSTGIFGSGRFSHHLRKLLAVVGASTNHTAGWHKHAIARYSEVKSASQENSELNLASMLWGDLRIAIAHTPTPGQFERFVLDSFNDQMSSQGTQIDILNRAVNGDSKCKITFPCNLPTDYMESTHKADRAIFTLKKSKDPMGVPSTASAQIEESEHYDDVLMINDEYQQYVKDMDEKYRCQFQRLLAWARTASSIDGNERKLLLETQRKGYADQPSGYCNVPMVLFAPLNDQGRAQPNEWVARIPLKCSNAKPMTVVLPERLRAKTALESEIIRGNDPNFAPRDVDDFLMRPEHYVKL